MASHANNQKENKSQPTTSKQLNDKSQSTLQFVDNRPENITHQKLQKTANSSVSKQHIIQQKENKTGLPDNLKSGIEQLSGYSMDDVKVHRNSNKPTQLQAHAYAQGTNIHLGPGQEKHLPHEAWHVVQQKQGRVQPTVQMKGNININDDKELEREADTMGQKALQMKSFSSNKMSKYQSVTSNKPIQRYVSIKDPLRMYENLPRLIELVHNAISAVASEHKGEAFYDRVLTDMPFFIEIVTELFKANPHYDKIKDFTDEIIQTGIAKSNYKPSKFNKEEWALLHRMESFSFKKFIASKEGVETDSVKNSDFEANNSKYNPSDFGDQTGKHSWKGNTEWLFHIMENFGKMVLTDIPITINNIFRQAKHTRIFAQKGERDLHTFSAYGREIAALLYEGYVPISKATVGIAGVHAVTMVKKELLPPTVQLAISKTVHVNKAAAKWIAKGTSLAGLGGGQGDKKTTIMALSFFHHAGIPTDIEVPHIFEADESESKHGAWAGKSFREKDEDEIERQRLIVEEREKEKDLVREKYRKVEADDLVKDSGRLIGFIRKVYGDFNVVEPYKRYNNKQALEYILSEGLKKGLIDEDMSKNKLRDFIKENRDELWPQ